ncbi:hydroxyacid dehydrogenase [Stenotrophomonas sp. BIIR7]|nr:hydroxyacid dehydrogenase [Stenotrophomonas sp. BIIR7]
MCDACGDLAHVPALAHLSRRSFVLGSSTLIAAGLVGGGAEAQAQARMAPEVDRAFPVRAYGNDAANAPITTRQIMRRALRPNDVFIDVLYCGICHSDIHQNRDDTPSQRTTFPIVTGHEIIGRVTAVGSAVTKFRVGDIGGVGAMVDSCGACTTCRAGREMNCLNGATFTYNSPDKISGGMTFGGYSDGIVVAEAFVVRVSPGVNLAASAPLLCAGITTFSPMQHWRLEAGQRVGIIGLGGLGHVAVKLAAARKADVTIFTTSPRKIADARRLGARQAVLWSDEASMKRLAGQFDLLVSTVPQPYAFQPFIDLLSLDGTLVNVGALEGLHSINGLSLIFGRKSIAGSVIGGIPETQALMDYCATRRITADIELIRPSQINEAFSRVVNKDVRYRFVIDMKA